MRKTLLFSFTLSLFILSACNLVRGQSTLTAVTPPAPPQAGKATVVGRVMSKETGEPMAGTLVRLAEVVRSGDEGVYVLDQAFSPGARTDNDGYFIFENIPAMEYVLIVGDVQRSYKVIEDEDKKPRAYNALADQILDVGVLTITLFP